MPRPVTIYLPRGLDWDLLRQQKQSLYEVVLQFKRKRDSKVEHLEGLLHLLDAIEDNRPDQSRKRA
jgi:hypothetical protein